MKKASFNKAKHVDIKRFDGATRFNLQGADPKTSSIQAEDAVSTFSKQVDPEERKARARQNWSPEAQALAEKYENKEQRKHHCMIL